MEYNVFDDVDGKSQFLRIFPVDKLYSSKVSIKIIINCQES